MGCTKWNYQKKQCFASKGGLKKLFVSHHPTLGLRVGSVGWNFFYFGEGQSRSQGLTAF